MTDKIKSLSTAEKDVLAVLWVIERLGEKGMLTQDGMRISCGEAQIVGKAHALGMSPSRFKQCVNVIFSKNIEDADVVIKLASHYGLIGLEPPS